MSTRTKPATVRFYVDADILGLARVLASLRPDTTFPGDPGASNHSRVRPPCSVTSVSTKDPVWIPIVTSEELIIISRDRHIHSRPGEIAAIRDAGARMVTLSAPDASTTWAQLETVMTNWRRIEALIGLPGPFIYTCTRTSMTALTLA